MTDSITEALKQRVLDDKNDAEHAVLNGGTKMTIDEYRYRIGQIDAFTRVLDRIDEVARLVEELE